jgi:hypothetical protein
MIKTSGFKLTIFSFNSLEMSINDLPNEILYKILSYVTNCSPSISEQLRELASLMGALVVCTNLSNQFYTVHLKKLINEVFFYISEPF